MSGRDLQPHRRRSCCLDVSHVTYVGNGAAGRIDEHATRETCGHHLSQELQPLCRSSYSALNKDPVEVAARVAPGYRQASADRVGDHPNTIGIVGSLLAATRRGRTEPGYDHVGAAAHQLGRSRRQAIVIASAQRYSIVMLLPVDPARLLQALPKCCARRPICHIVPQSSP